MRSILSLHSVHPSFVSCVSPGMMIPTGTCQEAAGTKETATAGGTVCSSLLGGYPPNVVDIDAMMI